MPLKKNLKRWIFGARGAFNYFGVKTYFPPKSGAFLIACENGIYERENVQLISEFVRPDTTYLDIGTNIGLMTIPILTRVNGTRAISFEVSPTTLPFLRRTIIESGFGERWRLVDKAVGEAVGETEFYVGQGDGAIFDGLRHTSRNAGANSERVQVTTVDSEWNQSGRPQVSAMKIDVEGGEIEVLRGACDCIRSTKPTILLEWNALNFNSYHHQPVDLLHFARSVDYLVFSASNFALIQNLATLELHMLRAENFLLRPADPLRGAEEA